MLSVCWTFKRRLACTTHGGGCKCSWPLLTLFFSLFLSLSCLIYPLRGILNKPIFFQTSYFGITKRNNKTKTFSLQKLIFARFFCFLQPSFGHEPGPTPTPWSIFTSFFLFLRLLLFTHFGDTQEANSFSSPHILAYLEWI